MLCPWMNYLRYTTGITSVSTYTYYSHQKEYLDNTLKSPTYTSQLKIINQTYSEQQEHLMQYQHSSVWGHPST